MIYSQKIIRKTFSYLKHHKRISEGRFMPRPQKEKSTATPLVKPKEKQPDKKPIEQYQHPDKKRCNNPPVGLVHSETDLDIGKKTYAYDPHIDPQLQWAGKTEHKSFEVPTVSLHVHERIDPRTIIEAVRKRNGSTHQISLFEFAGENPPIRQAIEFYKHKHGWSNRLIAGDSLLVMNSLLEKEGMAGKVQMIYIDPPYGIKYGSNFQPFVNKRDVKDGKDEDLTQEPEMVKAFRDTWELGIHSYLTYLRDRLLLARELLTDSGSVFVQISDENVHHVRELMDEVFGIGNFVAIITFAKTSSSTTKMVPITSDYLIWYGKNNEKIKFRKLFLPIENRDESEFEYAEFEDGTVVKVQKLSNNEVRKYRRFKLDDSSSQGERKEGIQPYFFHGKNYYPTPGRSWSYKIDSGMKILEKAGYIFAKGERILFKNYLDTAGPNKLDNIWLDTQLGGFHRRSEKIFVVQTAQKVIARCCLMTTDPGDLVLDPTCGSGTTAYVAEQWGRRWITCDTSRVAITLAKQRLMTAVYEYYDLAHPEEGVVSGFRYKTVLHITLKSIANNPDIHEGITQEQINVAIVRHADQETLYDQPLIDKSRARVTGPFTVEAVPSPTVRPLVEVEVDLPADISVARSGETYRQGRWIDELLVAGIRGKGGQKIEFSRVEPLAGTRYLHAEGETKEAKPQRVVISFGPEYAPLEQRQVELAIMEAAKLVPKPTIVLFAAFQFDPEAAKDIDEMQWAGVTFLKILMNADLFTDDLKKKRASNESFWLIGQPDVRLDLIKEGKDKGKYRVEVLGFDYYDTRKGDVISGGAHNIAVWMLDTDYDGRSLFPRQVFFPMANEKEGWSRLARNLKAEIDEELIGGYRGTVSLPFEKTQKDQRIAVKVVDDRGIESFRIIGVD
jgi:adenine-specific DNA-methyltransferase